jgi:exodeoxyribonuclease VII large subunit
VVARKGGAFAAADAAARRQLTTAERAVNAHDPQRTLERGYALVADRAGEPVASAAAARERERLVIRFADDAVGAEVNADGSDERPR